MSINHPRQLQDSVEDLNEFEQSMRDRRPVEHARILRLLKSEQVYIEKETIANLAC